MDVINKRKTDFFHFKLKKRSSYISSYNYFIFVLLIYITLRDLSSIDTFQSFPSSFPFLFLSLFTFFVQLISFFLLPVSVDFTHQFIYSVFCLTYLCFYCHQFSFSVPPVLLMFFLSNQQPLSTHNPLFTSRNHCFSFSLFFSVSENQSFWFDPLIFMDQSVFRHFFLSDCSSLLFHCSAPGKTLSKVALISFPNYSGLSCLLPATSGKNLQEFKLIN